MQSGSEQAIPSAVSWTLDLLVGQAGTAVAVLAIGFIGFQMLGGRIRFRRGVEIIMGCFIVFSASVIADGLTSRQRNLPAAVQSAPLPAYIPTAPEPVPYDPYAGASVPNTRPNQSIIK